jgi:hypothetical protein
MTEDKEPTADSLECLTLLDALIKQSHQELIDSLKGKVRLGDYLKMIEMRRKLSTGTASDRAFWEMINRIKSEIRDTPQNKPNLDNPRPKQGSSRR